VVLATLGTGAAWAQDGHGCILGWGHQVIAGDLSAGFQALAAGRFHSLGIKVDGAVVAWGDNSYGQCNLPSPNADFVAVAAGGGLWGGGSRSLGIKGYPRGDLNCDRKIDLRDINPFVRLLMQP
jgi:hypothetical protein